MRERKPWVRKHRDSKYWFGVFYTWDAETKAWKRSERSTGTDVELTALEIAKEWQRLAYEAAARPEFITRERALDTVNMIMRIAGASPIDDQVIWQDFADSWLELKKRPVLAGEVDRTLESYQSHVRNFGKWLGTKTRWAIGRMDEHLLQGFYDHLLNSGRSPKTAKNIIKTLSMIFERAKDKGITRINPVSLIMRDPTKGGERKKDVFTPDDFQRLVKACQNWADEDPDSPAGDWLTMTILGWCTGRRLEDCAQAQWQHFDLNGRDGKLPHWELRPRKLRRLNKVEVMPLIEPLLSHLREKRRRSSDLWVCPKLASVSKLSDRFNEVVDKAKVPYRVIVALGSEGRNTRSKGFHSFRHTLTTRLALAGVDTRISKLIVGHSDDKVHEGYTHWDLDSMYSAMEKIK